MPVNMLPVDPPQWPAELTPPGVRGAMRRGKRLPRPHFPLDSARERDYIIGMEEQMEFTLEELTTMRDSVLGTYGSLNHDSRDVEPLTAQNVMSLLVKLNGEIVNQGGEAQWPL
jgi:hypothetical protein